MSEENSGRSSTIEKDSEASNSTRLIDKLSLAISITALIAVISLGYYFHYEMTMMESQRADNAEKFSNLQKKHEDLEVNILRLKIESLQRDVQGLVDLSEPSVQDIGQSGFHVTRLSVEEHLTGVKVRGRLINTQSVDHTNITINIVIGDSSKEFTVFRVSSGNSTAFDVYLPDVSVKDARYCKFEYKSSIVHFHTK